MSFVRSAYHPIELITAELFSFPFNSQIALELGVTQLHTTIAEIPSRRSRDRHVANTKELWRKAEIYLLKQFPSVSVEELIAIRDATWFAPIANQRNDLLTDRRQGITLQSILEQFATSRLELRGDSLVPIQPVRRFDRKDGQPFGESDARRAWYWWSLSLPPSLFASVFPGSRGRIDPIPPLLEKTFADSDGFSETHLHFGAAFRFDEIWALLNDQVSSIEADDLSSPGAEFDDGLHLLPWLLASACGRFILAAGLDKRGSSHSASSNAIENICDLVSVSDRGDVGDALKLGERFLVQASWRNSLNPATLSRICGKMKYGLQRLRNRYQASCGDLKNAPLEKHDPLNLLFRGAREYRKSCDLRLGQSWSHYEKDCNKANAKVDRKLELIYWQLVRVQSIFYRHVVQRPQVPGLQWFVRFFDRLRPAKRGLSNRARIHNAARLSGLGKGLRSFEVRTAPPKSKAELVTELADVEKVFGDLRAIDDSLSCGLVYHIVKNREGGFLEGSPNAFGVDMLRDPGKFKSLRFGRYLNQILQIERESLTAGAKTVNIDGALGTLWSALNDCLLFPHRNKVILHVLKGLDVCTDELGVDNWALAPGIRQIRAAAERVIAADNYRNDDLGNHDCKELRFQLTAHVGEDFTHLLTGLRNIDETIDSFGLRHGDRIGHGLALGVSPHDWAKSSGLVPMALEDRLLDLVWAWDIATFEGLDVPSRMLNRIRREATEIAVSLLSTWSSWFASASKQRGFESIVRLRRDLLDSNVLIRCLRTLDFDKDRSLVPRSVLRMFLTNRAWYLKGRTTVWVDTSLDSELLFEIQSFVRRRLCDHAIAVEVNPSSNLLVGNMADLDRHPLWRLRPPRQSQEHQPRLTLCVGSDDPITFATDIRREYARLYDVLLLGGMGHDDALRWLDEVRRSSLVHSFT